LPNQQTKFLHCLGHLLPGGWVPAKAVIAMASSKCLESGGRSRDLRLARHQGRAAKHPRRAEELVSRGRLRVVGEDGEAVQALASLQGEEVSGPER
jgi:hypothetical protein